MTPHFGVAALGLREEGLVDQSSDQVTPKRRLLVRQTRVPGQPRPFIHKVRVSAAQEEMLLHLSEKMGDLSIPKLMVQSTLMGGSENLHNAKHLSAELMRISRLLGRVSVNVNQIARATNATGELQSDTQATLAAMRRVTERIDEMLDKINGPL
ncbi:MobC family plasmid mobilization relaxosome protein [Paeniglutamicibacter sp. NPDC091659]|uniref:MobC family plasmid mobilization relaxosome protein n=1 Tax=Paeniglutamicibacter sp. NPDC091659 TaxID=3364389 RepID=UPI0038059158